MADKETKTKEKEMPGLEEKGVLFLTGEMNDETCGKVINGIIRANMEPQSEFLQLMISSSGGSVHSGFALIDMMRWSRLPVCTTGFGIVASMAVSVLIAGEPGRRVVTPNTTLLTHQFWTHTQDNYAGIVAKRKMEDLTHKRLVDHYLACGFLKTAEEVENKLMNGVDTWLTPQEALDYGLIDQIYQPALKPVQKSRV